VDSENSRRLNDASNSIYISLGQQKIDPSCRSNSKFIGFNWTWHLLTMDFLFLFWYLCLASKENTNYDYSNNNKPHKHDRSNVLHAHDSRLAYNDNIYTRPNFAWLYTWALITYSHAIKKTWIKFYEEFPVFNWTYITQWILNRKITEEKTVTEEGMRNTLISIIFFFQCV
jgi:hypothetical protein